MRPGAQMYYASATIVFYRCKKTFTDVLRKRDKRWPVWIMQFSQVAACLAQVPLLVSGSLPRPKLLSRPEAGRRWQIKGNAKAKPRQWHSRHSSAFTLSRARCPTCTPMSRSSTVAAQGHCNGRGRKRGQGARLTRVPFFYVRLA